MVAFLCHNSQQWYSLGTINLVIKKSPKGLPVIQGSKTEGTEAPKTFYNIYKTKNVIQFISQFFIIETLLLNSWSNWSAGCWTWYWKPTRVTLAIMSLALPLPVPPQLWSQSWVTVSQTAQCSLRSLTEW